MLTSYRVETRRDLTQSVAALCCDEPTKNNTTQPHGKASVELQTTKAVTIYGLLTECLHQISDQDQAAVDDILRFGAADRPAINLMNKVQRRYKFGGKIMFPCQKKPSNISLEIDRWLVSF